MNSPKDHSAENQLKWWRSPGVICFLAAGTPAAAIKIGVTTRPTLFDLMKKTQAHNHEPIELLGVIRFSDGEFPTRDAEDQPRRLQAAHPRIRVVHCLAGAAGDDRGAVHFSGDAGIPTLRLHPCQ